MDTVTEPATEPVTDYDYEPDTAAMFAELVPRWCESRADEDGKPASQVALAKALTEALGFSVPRQHVSQWMTGTRSHPPRWSVVMRMCADLGFGVWLTPAGWQLRDVKGAGADIHVGPDDEPDRYDLFVELLPLWQRWHGADAKKMATQSDLAEYLDARIDGRVFAHHVSEWKHRKRWPPRWSVVMLMCRDVTLGVWCEPGKPAKLFANG